jgi:SAM-dependent methyltransferase
LHFLVARPLDTARPQRKHRCVRPVRELLPILRCPACRADRLREAEGALTCDGCGRTFPVAPYVDLGLGPAPVPPGSLGFAQWTMELGPLARVYERWWRPAFVAAQGLLGVPFEAEWFVIRHALGLDYCRGPWLDLACGPGVHTRAIAAAAPDDLVVGVDLSPAMLARAAETVPGAAFVRGDVHALPLRDRVFAGVNNGAALHLYARPAEALREVFRVLAPGGVYVLSTLLRAGPSRLFAPLGDRLGLHLWREDELQAALGAAGFVDYRAARRGGLLLARVRRPG